MKLIVLFSFALVLCLSIHPRDHQYQTTLNHQTWNDFSRSISQECCKQLNGTQCGSVDIDCCKYGCETHGWGWFSYQSCKADSNGSTEQKDVQIRECPTSCNAQCKSKGGKLCGIGVIADQQCCQITNCVFSTDTKGDACKPNTQIDISGCTKDSLRDQIAGHKHQ